MTWQAGRSGNPRGRPPAALSVAAMVRDSTEDGAWIVREILSVARGQHKEITDARSRTWALEWLADRAFGKPIQAVDLHLAQAAHAEPLAPLNMAGLTDSELELFAALGGKASGQALAPHEEQALARLAAAQPRLALIAAPVPDDLQKTGSG